MAIFLNDFNILPQCGSAGFQSLATKEMQPNCFDKKIYTQKQGNSWPITDKECSLLSAPPGLSGGRSLGYGCRRESLIGLEDIAGHITLLQE
jgi:hypothetical protein